MDDNLPNAVEVENNIIYINDATLEELYCESESVMLVRSICNSKRLKTICIKIICSELVLVGMIILLIFIIMLFMNMLLFG